MGWEGVPVGCEKVVIYCDGGCRKKSCDSTGIGGWGVHAEYGNLSSKYGDLSLEHDVLSSEHDALSSEYGDLSSELHGGARDTTSNVMELTACIEALKQLDGRLALAKITLAKNAKIVLAKNAKIALAKNAKIVVVSDSQYLINGMNVWSKTWRQNGWITSTRKRVKNLELWKELVRLADSFENLEFVWVPGHSGFAGNERADQLVNLAMNEIELELRLEETKIQMDELDSDLLKLKLEIGIGGVG